LCKMVENSPPKKSLPTTKGYFINKS
jgi:hypothetical protein